MKEERMYVLNLLGEGKVSADEAAKLLDALGKKGKKEFWDDDVRPEERLRSFSKSAQDFAKDCGGKMENAYKEMEPKVKAATKTVMKKTAEIVDDISKSLHESLSNMEAKECGTGDTKSKEDADDE